MIISGVLATALDAVDIANRVNFVPDAICSSSDKGHEMLMRLGCRKMRIVERGFAIDIGHAPRAF